jgi:hypothetical protein
LILYDKYKTGLVTKDGNLKPSDIITNKRYIKLFAQWKRYKYDVHDRDINIESFEGHVNAGLVIAKYLKKKVGDKIKVLYYYQSLETYKERGHLNHTVELEL